MACSTLGTHWVAWQAHIILAMYRVANLRRGGDYHTYRYIDRYILRHVRNVTLWSLVVVSVIIQVLQCVWYPHPQGTSALLLQKIRYSAPRSLSNMIHSLVLCAFEIIPASSATRIHNLSIHSEVDSHRRREWPDTSLCRWRTRGWYLLLHVARIQSFHERIMHVPQEQESILSYWIRCNLMSRCPDLYIYMNMVAATTMLAFPQRDSQQCQVRTWRRPIYRPRLTCTRGADSLVDTYCILLSEAFTWCPLRHILGAVQKTVVLYVLIWH